MCTCDNRSSLPYALFIGMYILLVTCEIRLVQYSSTSTYFNYSDTVVWMAYTLKRSRYSTVVYHGSSSWGSLLVLPNLNYYSTAVPFTRL